MPKVEQIDIKAIFEKASGHKIVDSTVTKVYSMVPLPVDGSPAN